MKATMLALILSAICPVPAFANESFGIMNDPLGSALQDNANNHNVDDRVNSAYNDAKQAIGGSMDTSHATPVTGTASPATISGYGQAYTDAKNEVSQMAGGFGQSYIDAKNTPSGYVKNDPTGSPVAQATSVNATSYRLGIAQQQQQMRGVAPVLASQTINVVASSLAPATQVDITVNGITQTVVASALASSTQVAVPHVAVFQRNHPGNSGNQGHGAGDNNGNQNEHDYAMGRSAGVGGHSEFR